MCPARVLENISDGLHSPPSRRPAAATGGGGGGRGGRGAILPGGGCHRRGPVAGRSSAARRAGPRSGRGCGRGPVYALFASTRAKLASARGANPSFGGSAVRPPCYRSRTAPLLERVGGNSPIIEPVERHGPTGRLRARLVGRSSAASRGRSMSRRPSYRRRWRPRQPRVRNPGQATSAACGRTRRTGPGPPSCLSVRFDLPQDQLAEQVVL